MEHERGIISSRIVVVIISSDSANRQGQSRRDAPVVAEGEFIFWPSVE